MGPPTPIPEWTPDPTSFIVGPGEAVEGRSIGRNRVSSAISAIIDRAGRCVEASFGLSKVDVGEEKKRALGFFRAQGRLPRVVLMLIVPTHRLCIVPKQQRAELAFSPPNLARFELGHRRPCGVAVGPCAAGDRVRGRGGRRPTENDPRDARATDLEVSPPCGTEQSGRLAPRLPDERRGGRERRWSGAPCAGVTSDAHRVPCDNGAGPSGSAGALERFAPSGTTLPPALLSGATPHPAGRRAWTAANPGDRTVPTCLASLGGKPAARGSHPSLPTFDRSEESSTMEFGTGSGHRRRLSMIGPAAAARNAGTDRLPSPSPRRDRLARDFPPRVPAGFYKERRTPCSGN